MDWSMDWTTVFTGLLVLVTGGLVWVGWRQIQDARVLQRAYVSAAPGGTTTHGELLASQFTIGMTAASRSIKAEASFRFHRTTILTCSPTASQSAAS
jgi:hypothetical protein